MKAIEPIQNPNDEFRKKSEAEVFSFSARHGESVGLGPSCSMKKRAAPVQFRISSFVIRHSSFTLSLALSVAAISGCKPRKELANEPPPPKVEGERIIFADDSPQLHAIAVSSAEAPVTQTARLNGRLVWNDDLTVRVFSPVSGRIGAICANFGQAVSPGDTLAKIASPEFGLAQAEARKALTDLKLGERALNRLKELYEHGAAAQKDLEAAEGDHARAVSESERALATLALYGGECASTDKFCALKAPISGLVVEKSINPGQEVRADQVGGESKPLFVISDPSRLWVILDATEADLSWLHPGAEVKLRSQTYAERLFTAHVEVIADAIDPVTRTIKVRGTVDNTERLLKAEMFVSAELSTPAQGAAIIPSSGIFLGGDKHYAFVEAGRGIFQLQQVSVGLHNGGVTLVTKGIQAGQKVVTEGALFLNQLLVERPYQETSPLALAHD